MTKKTAEGDPKFPHRDASGEHTNPESTPKRPPAWTFLTVSSRSARDDRDVLTQQGAVTMVIGPCQHNTIVAKCLRGVGYGDTFKRFVKFPLRTQHGDGPHQMVCAGPKPD